MAVEGAGHMKIVISLIYVIFKHKKTIQINLHFGIFELDLLTGTELGNKKKSFNMYM